MLTLSLSLSLLYRGGGGGDRGCLGEAKVSWILRHRGVHLILAYSWTRPAVFAAGEGRGGMFLFLRFLHFHSYSFLPCPSLWSPLLSLLSSLSLFSGRRHKMTHKGWRVVKPWLMLFYVQGGHRCETITDIAFAPVRPLLLRSLRRSCDEDV